MSNPWNGKVVLEAFVWDAKNDNYPYDWYTYLAKLAPRLAAMGFDGIWTPPPCKDTDAHNNMGYTPFDYYDLGQKNQKGAVETRFGSQDAFLRLVAVAHANGLEVYPDIVLDHCGSGDPDPDSPFQDEHRKYSRIQPPGFAGAGRWPRNWLDFHFNPVHWNPIQWNPGKDWTPDAADDPGHDFCYQGRCSDSGSANPNCAARQNARAWLSWFVRQTGVDGFRFDDVKGYPPEVVEDLLYNAMGDRRDYFCVGEYAPNCKSLEMDAWADGTQNRAGTFDYTLSDALLELVESNGYYDVGHLPSLQQQNRYKTVPFVNNHDTFPGNPQLTRAHIDPDNPRTRLAYAFAMAVDGSPQLFYADLFTTTPPWDDKATADGIPTRAWMENLVWCHQKLAIKSGDYFVRYQGSQTLLIIERGARAIVAINNDGSAWHDAWISTAFFPNTQLHGYSGSRPDDIWVNEGGWVHIAVPPLSYSVWGPAGVGGGFSPTPKRTVQRFEMDDDLGDNDPAGPQYGGKAIAGTYRAAGAIWPAPESSVILNVTSDTAQQVDVQVVVRGEGNPTFTTSGATPLAASFPCASEGYHILRVRLSDPADPPTRVYVEADYLGPATSSAF